MGQLFVKKASDGPCLQRKLNGRKGDRPQSLSRSRPEGDEGLTKWGCLFLWGHPFGLVLKVNQKHTKHYQGFSPIWRQTERQVSPDKRRNAPQFVGSLAANGPNQDFPPHGTPKRACSSMLWPTVTTGFTDFSWGSESFRPSMSLSSWTFGNHSLRTAVYAFCSKSGFLLVA